MKIKCKYLINSTDSWDENLVNACHDLELYVERLNGVKITNSLSDFQPSYLVYKEVEGVTHTLKIDPRVHNGKIFYNLRDQHGNPNKLGGELNPYKLDFQMIKSLIKILAM